MLGVYYLLTYDLKMYFICVISPQNYEKYLFYGIKSG